MTYTVRKRVPEDRQLVIDVPPDVDVGCEVEITVAAAQPAESGTALAAWLKSRDEAGWSGSGRTRDEVDAEIAALRDEWDTD
jgi:hypothetical protein